MSSGNQLPRQEQAPVDPRLAGEAGKVFENQAKNTLRSRMGNFIRKLKDRFAGGGETSKPVEPGLAAYQSSEQVISHVDTEIVGAESAQPLEKPEKGEQHATIISDAEPVLVPQDKSLDDIDNLATVAAKDAVGEDVDTLVHPDLEEAEEKQWRIEGQISSHFPYLPNELKGATAELLLSYNYDSDNKDFYHHDALLGLQDSFRAAQEGKFLPFEDKTDSDLAGYDKSTVAGFNAKLREYADEHTDSSSVVEDAEDILSSEVSNNESPDSARKKEIKEFIGERLGEDIPRKLKEAIAIAVIDLGGPEDAETLMMFLESDLEDARKGELKLGEGYGDDGIDKGLKRMNWLSKIAKRNKENVEENR